jgi:hypothetical protein
MPGFEYELFIPQVQKAEEPRESEAQMRYPSLHSNASLYKKFASVEEAKEFSKMQEIASV